MNCPYCGKEMLTGKMYTRKFPLWSTKLPVYRAADEAIICHPLGDDSSGSFAFHFHEFPDSMHCPDCKAIVFQYHTVENDHMED